MVSIFVKCPVSTLCKGGNRASTISTVKEEIERVGRMLLAYVSFSLLPGVVRC